MRWWPVLIGAVLMAGCAHYQPQLLDAARTAMGLEARTLSGEGLRRFLEYNQPGSVKQWPLKSWPLDELVLAALYYNPSLDVARADWDLARAGVITAGGRLNPSVSVDAGYEVGGVNSVSPWIPAISFDVPFETAGKRQRRIETAQHLTEAARLSIATTAWQVRSGVRNALLSFQAARQRADLLQQQIHLQEEIVDRLKLELQAGAIGTAELTTARVALANALASLAAERRQLAKARASLAEAVGVPAAALNDVEFSFDFAQTGVPGDLTSTAVRDTALHSRTDILAGLERYAATQSALQLEIAKQYPDVHLSPGYSWNQQGEGEHEWQLGLSLELPVLNRNQGPIAEAEARRKVAAAQFLALQAQVIGQIDGALEVYQASRTNLEALQSLVAANQKQKEITQAQAKAGAADQLQVLSSELEFQTATLAEFDARVQLQQSAAAVEDAVQRPFRMPQGIYETIARNPR